MCKVLASHISVVDLTVDYDARVELKSNRERPVPVRLEDRVVSVQISHERIVDALVKCLDLLVSVNFYSRPVIAVFERLCLKTVVDEALLKVLEHGPENNTLALVLFGDDLMKAFFSETLNDYFPTSELESGPWLVDAV